MGSPIGTGSQPNREESLTCEQLVWQIRNEMFRRDGQLSPKAMEIVKAKSRRSLAWLNAGRRFS